MDQEHLAHLRHTLAHILVAAVRELYPHAKPTIGPAIDNGFYYDFDFAGGEKPGDRELQKIEQKMREILKKWEIIEREEVTEAGAREHFAGNPYKLELVEEIIARGEPLTLYHSLQTRDSNLHTPAFSDLCRGGHSEHPNKDIPSTCFSLDRIAGAYWRGDEKNAMLTRIYGLAFESKEALAAYKTQVEEAKKRDHRKIGKELGLFTFSDLVGAGLPLYMPKGTVLREELARFSEELQRSYGFEKVWIPHITKIDLYKTSGHWDKFGHELMLVQSQESNDSFALKPMNCPHHTQIYAAEPRSYRDLPVRLMETTTCYRDEKTGELSGLTRVRSLTQDDAHVFCRMDQVEQEFENIMTMIKTMYATLGLSFHARLSFSDPAKPEEYLGDRENWDLAEKSIEHIAQKLELEYFIAHGEAAFYGPKIDIMVIDALGRQWQCATQQLDFVQPSRFGLEYTDADGTKKTPIMIHKALLGTIDRFLGVYIEHTAGLFPLWLSPVQLRVIPIGDDHAEYAREVYTLLKKAGIRVELDTSNDSLGKRIRNAKVGKLPYFAVIGDKEVEAHTVTLESRSGTTTTLTPEVLRDTLLEQINSRALDN